MTQDSSVISQQLLAVWSALVALVSSLWTLFYEVFRTAPLLFVWIAICLWALNWKKTWPILARGGWVPLVLAMVLIALVWSQLQPMDYAIVGVTTIGNFWWQLGAVATIVGLGLFCGWVQGLRGWAPPDLELFPLSDEDHGHHSTEPSENHATPSPTAAGAHH